METYTIVLEDDTTGTMRSDDGVSIGDEVEILCQNENGVRFNVTGIVKEVL